MWPQFIQLLLCLEQAVYQLSYPWCHCELVACWDFIWREGNTLQNAPGPVFCVMLVLDFGCSVPFTTWARGICRCTYPLLQSLFLPSVCCRERKRRRERMSSETEAALRSTAMSVPAGREGLTCRETNLAMLSQGLTSAEQSQTQTFLPNKGLCLMLSSCYIMVLWQNH